MASIITRAVTAATGSGSGMFGVVTDVVSAVAKEGATAAAHLMLYPAGLLAESERGDPRFRIDNLTPVSRGLVLSDLDAHGTPIVLVHGLVDNRSAFAVLRRAMRRRGFGRVSTVNYSPLTADVPSAAAKLGRHIERICATSGYEKVHVVGHSLGGLIARYYVQRQGGDHRVDTLVTLGTPHQGSNLARLAPIFVARQLRPSAEVIRDLARPALCTTRFVAIWSDYDEVIVPASNAKLEHPDLQAVNIKVHGIGHLALLVDYDVVHTVIESLRGRGATEPNWEQPHLPTPTNPLPGLHDTHRRMETVAAYERVDAGAGWQRAEL